MQQPSSRSVAMLAALLLAGLSQVAATNASDTQELAGLWQAKRRFGPDIRGTLLISQGGSDWQAEIAGRRVPVAITGDALTFELADGREGKFRGTFDAGRARIVGHWIQQQRVENGLTMASPVVLTKLEGNQWRGTVVPADDTFTFYLMVEARDDGTVGAFLRNPERNLGWMRFRADAIERDGENIRLLAQGKAPGERTVVAEGRYRQDPETLTIRFDYGGLQDFTRVPAGEPSDFYPRGMPGVRYRYAAPPQLDDGWQTASLEDVGISRERIEAFIQQLIDRPIDSAVAQEDHGVLIARYGKLVLEDYFHGEHRERPHDTRSASKSVASDLFGAALHAGLPVSTSARVYSVMNGGKMPPGIEPRRQALKIEHLLTMSSGLDCDENDEDSPGFEDRMWEQTSHPDFYSWTMALDMVREPGEAPVYCSASANLVGGVIARATGRYLPALFHELIAAPLQISRYYLPLSPTGDYTMTGGARFLPRDFMKLAQVHLDGGTWNGRRIYTEEWSDQAAAPRHDMGSYKYGYLWWVVEYPYRGRTVRAYFAAGNGGQIAMAIPDLRLAMAFYGGNYNAPGGRRATDEYVPGFILPAVDEHKH